MRFVRNSDGCMELKSERKRVVENFQKTSPNTSYIVETREVKSYVKEMKFLNSKALSITPMVVAVAVAPVSGGTDILWNTFITYVYPWFLDIARVYCAVKIAQGFYEEKRSNGKEGSGVNNFTSYAKWLLLFHLIPWGVELINQIGISMTDSLIKNPNR